MCFYSNTSVQLESGEFVTMENLKYGDRVYSHIEDGHKIYSQIISFSGWDLESIGSSIKIFTENEHFIIISDTHLIYNYTLGKYVKANELKLGEYVLVNNRPKKILLVSQGTHRGWISPLTQSNKIQANGFAAACHTHDLRFIYLPLRIFLRFFPNSPNTQPKANSWFYN